MKVFKRGAKIIESCCWPILKAGIVYFTMQALSPMPYRYFALKLKGNDSYRFLLAFATLTPPSEGKYGEAIFPDGLNIWLTDEDWKKLEKINKADEKDS